MNSILWLEKWYQNNCDSSWEHSYGIEIGTLDNPGWYVKIDLRETDYVYSKSKELNQDLADDNWVKCSIANGTFTGFGDCMKLETIIQIFREWIEGDNG